MRYQSANRGNKRGNYLIAKFKYPMTALFAGRNVEDTLPPTTQ